MTKLKIAVGIIMNPQREIFVTRRANDAHMAGKWEFPGGKVETGESAEQALVRELAEEVGITAQDYRLFAQREHQFADRHVSLFFYLVTAWQGQPFGKEGQPAQWLACEDLQPAAFPPANVPIIAQLQAES